MSNSKGVETPNKQYETAKFYVEQMRDAMTGEPALKSNEKRKIYLPPSCEDNNQQSFEEIQQYKRYLQRAEYDNIPRKTLSALIGAIFRNNPTYNLGALSDFEQDADGDGLTMTEMLKITASELLQMNYVFLLAEYQGLANSNSEEITAAETSESRSVIKMYSRENIINWNHRRINGRLQLSMIVFMECEEGQEIDSYESKEYKSYLVLALDENGQYFQQKYVETDDIGWSEPIYPQANGSNLDYIPGDFIFASDYSKGDVSLDMGYLHNIACKSIARYQANADLKESLYFSGAPVSTSSGWTEQGLELYKQMTGREYIGAAPGSHIPLPEDSKFEIAQWQADGNAIFKYMDQNAAEIRALGGVFDTEESKQDQTATAAAINRAEKMGVLSSIVINIEEGFDRVLGYCAEFEGVVAPGDAVELNKEYQPKGIDAQQRTSILNEYIQGLISRAEALRQLERAGILTDTAEVLLNEAELDGE